MAAPRNNLQDQLKRLGAGAKVNSRPTGPLTPASQLKVSNLLSGHVEWQG